MVSHGIGGCTVEEAKERISYDEYLSWCAYVRKRGTLNLGMRVEAGFALLATMVNRATGGQAKMEDFMPHADKLEDQQQATLHNVFSMLKAKAKRAA